MSRRRGISDRVVTVPFKFYNVSTIATGTSSVVRIMFPNFGRLNVVSPAFEFYRFTKLRVELPPIQNSNAADTSDQPTVAVAYYPETVDVTSTSISLSTVLQQLRSTYQVMQQSDASNGIIPGSTVYRSFSVPRPELTQLPLKWYPVASTMSDPDSTQGSFVVATSSVPPAGGLPVPFLLTGEVEFRGFADASISLPLPAAVDDEKADGVLIPTPAPKPIPRRSRN
jgi:hypothetical protein